MLAKVIAYAPTRGEAARRLAEALARARIHGLRTNRELLVRLLGHPEYLAGKTDTQFLERHSPVELGAPLGDARVERVHAAAAALCAQAERRAAASVLKSIPSGWRNNASEAQHAKFVGRSGELAVDYRWQRSGLSLGVNGQALEKARVGRCTADIVELETEGWLRTFEVHRVGNTFYVDSPLGSSELRELDRFPAAEEEVASGSLLAPLPGVVDSVKVQVGDGVEAGDVLIVIESMKMLHRVAAPVAGRVAELRVAAASHVEAGTVLAVIEAVEGSTS
jgi:propionyl-CoA carboxylase alpha chain